jgi:hypothetical protein
MMDKVTLDDLNALAVQGNGPCVSLFMPTHRAGDDTRQDPIRLKNLLGQAEAQLVDAGLRSPVAREVLQPAQALLDESAFWRHLSDGLALYAAPGLFRTYRLPLDLSELLIVAPRFHVKPLLPFFAGDGHFFILALSQNQVRLLEATRYGVDEIELGDMPTSMAEALPHEDFEKHLQFQTGTGTGGEGGGRAAAFHGHDPEDDAKNRILRYFQRVDEGLRQVLHGERVPLVLAGVDYLLPIYREANGYPHLLEEGISGNPDELKAEELRAPAWAIVEPHFASDHRQALADYAQQAGTGRTSGRISEVVPAAHHGRVGVLWVALDTAAWGRYDAETGSAQRRDEPEPGDGDLLELAALQTLANGGTVYAVDALDVPGGGPLAALFRY